MADVQSNIKVSIDTTEALASIKNLQRQISAFHTSMARGGAAANAVTSQMQQNLINSINATGKFSAQMRTIKTTTESFTSSLEKNKFSMGEYFRYAGGASKTFGRLFKTEFETINKVARENVKDLQTQYIKMGRDANGAMKAIAVRPLSLDMGNLATKTMIASEKQAILNQLLKQGSTNLLNFGKNTQWAGRQLMVGFTIPLMALGAAASKTFMDMETQAIRFKKVYGDLFTSTTESTAALDAIKNLGKEFTKYGIAVSDTVGLASEAAAAGFKGVDLQRQTAAATRLSILGQVESQKALETTIALQNAFSMSSADLATNIDFLNAVENQTVLSLDDMSTAIPKAAPVIQQLGGDVKDLAFFMAAMKEGGINASEGANALKSGLASMINPTGKASAMLEGFGINIKKIVVDNKGDLKKTVIDFATALNQLDPLNRAQAIEQMFGKFQFARLSTLFANVTKDGTQAARVLDLAGSSIQDLAALSEKELGQTSESAMNKFKASVENLKLSLVPVGEEFLKAVTPIAQFVADILDKFNNLGSGTKKTIVMITMIVGALGPVLLMTFGLLANGLANIIKGFTAMKSLFNKTGQSSATLGTEVKYMTTEQRNAAAVAASLDQVHRKLAQTFTAEANAVDRLTAAYSRSLAAQRNFVPTGVPMGRGPIKKYAAGKPIVVGGTGNEDSELALLMPGETVIPTKMSKKYASLINGMITDSIPGYEVGRGTTSSTPAYWTAAKRNAFLDSLGLTGRERIRIPLAGDTPAYSTSGVMAPASVNDTTAGMTRQYIQSEIGRFSYNENIRIGLEDAGVSAKRISKIFDEVGPTLKDAIDNFDDTTGEWSKTAQNAMQAINKNPNITESEKIAIRKRIAPLMPEDYTVGSKRVLEVSRRRAVPRAERVNAPAQYGSARMLRRLKLRFPNEDFSRYEYSHMPGQASIPAQQSNVAEPTIGTGVKGVKGRPLTAREISIIAQERKNIESRSSESSETVGKKDAKSYSKAVENNTEDIYVKSRDRKSPHPLAPKDGTDDARAYNRAVNKELTRGAKKRRAAYRPQGPAPIIPVSTVDPRVIPFSDLDTQVKPPIITPIIPSGYTPPDDPMLGPRTPTKYDKTIGKFAGKFRGTSARIGSRFSNRGMGMGLATAGIVASQMVPGKAGDILGIVSTVAFSLSALQPVITGLIAVFGGAAVAIGAGIAAAVVGIGLAVYLFNKSAKKSSEEIIESAKRESEARIGSARAVLQFAKAFNKALPSEREFSRSNRQKIKGSGTLVDQYAKEYATKGNFSTQIINQAAKRGQAAGIEAIAIDVANKAAILGLSPEEIAANIKAASNLIEADEVKVKARIQQLLSPGGKDILKEPLTIDARLNYLNKQSTPIIENIDKSINAVSKIKFGQKNFLPFAETADYESMKSAAGSWDSITASWKGDFWDKALAAGKLWAFGVSEGLGALKDPKFLANPQQAISEELYNISGPGVVEDFEAIQSRVQGASTRVSIAFMQQKEALGLLNAQYADGQISEAQYNEQKLISNKNLDMLEKSSVKLVKQLNKIDKSGELASGVIKDFADQSLSALKAANPDKFDEITKAISSLPDESEIGIYMGYTRGSLTLMDLAIIPQLLKDITGKKYSAAIDIIMKSGLSEEGGQPQFLKMAAEQELARLEQLAAGQLTLDKDLLVAIASEKAKIAKYTKQIQEAEKPDPVGLLNSDLDEYKDLTEGSTAATEAYLDILQKEIDALKAKRDAQKDANDEVQREIDLKMKLQDLANEAVQAKISGNYLKAAMLTQEAQNVQLKYNQETELIKKDNQIAKLEARYQAIQDGAVLTSAENAKLKSENAKLKGKKKGYASGGHIRGAGTATSDSIPAYLSNGEYVIKAASVNKYGTETFDALNAQRFALGGPVGHSVGYHVGGPVGHKHLSPGHMASNYKAPYSGPVFKNADNITPAQRFANANATDAWYKKDGGYYKNSEGKWVKKDPSLWETFTTGENWKSLFGGYNPGGPILEETRKGLFGLTMGSGAYDRMNSGKPLAGGEYATMAANILLARIAGPQASALMRSMIEQVGISKGIPGLGSLLPTGSFSFLGKTGSQIGAKLGLAGAAYAIPNKINQINNYMKVKSLIKDDMWHGSQPTGLRGEEYLQGKNVLDGSETYDPHYGMGFFGTSSKSEAEMYASGYNSSTNWGESFGSLNKITKAPFGKYVDFTKGTNSIKWQDYGLYKALGMEKDGYLGNYLTENLGDIMAGQNVTGSIMKRISDGQVPGDMGLAKWLAWSKPAGVETEEYLGKRFASAKAPNVLNTLRSKLSSFNALDTTSGVNSVFEELAQVTMNKSLVPDPIQFPNILKKSDLKKIFPTLTGSLNTVNKAEVLKTGEMGYLKSGLQLNPLEVRREIFGSLFARRADLLAPSNTPVQLSNSSWINPFGVFSRSLEEMSPGSLSEKFLFNKLKVSQRDTGMYDKTFALTSKNYASLGMTSEKSYRDAILDSMGFTDSHGGNLFVNPMEKKAGAIDFGRIGESEHSVDIFGGQKALDALDNKYYYRYIHLPESERSAYLEGLTKASETLSGIKDTELTDMLRMSGYRNDEIAPTSDIYKSYISNVMQAIKNRLSSKREGWDEDIPKINVNEDWYKKIGASFNAVSKKGKNIRPKDMQKFLSKVLGDVSLPPIVKQDLAPGLGGVYIPRFFDQASNYENLLPRILINAKGKTPLGTAVHETMHHFDLDVLHDSFKKTLTHLRKSGKSNLADEYESVFVSAENIQKGKGAEAFEYYAQNLGDLDSIAYSNGTAEAFADEQTFKAYNYFKNSKNFKDKMLASQIGNPYSSSKIGQGLTGYFNTYSQFEQNALQNPLRFNASFLKGFLENSPNMPDKTKAIYAMWQKGLEKFNIAYDPDPSVILNSPEFKSFKEYINSSKLNKVKGYKVGGHIKGAGTATSDSIPAYLSNGEYVIKASSVKKYGTDTFDALNAQKFSTGSPGGVKPGAISKAGLMKANAKAGAMWQAMEEIEKGLSLKYGANPNSSGLEKWSKAFGRVAFNTLQGGVSGAVAAPSPWAVLTGAVAGLAEGLYGIGTEGSQYGVKGGKYATPKGAKTRRFNPKEQLDNMNLMGSAGNIAMSGAFSSVLGMLPFKRMAEGIGKIVPKSVKNFGTNAKESIQSKLSSANNIKIGNPLKSDKLKNSIVAAMIGFQKPFLGNSTQSSLLESRLSKTAIVDTVRDNIGNYKVNKVTIGDRGYKSYQLEGSKKPVIFQGHTEDLSDVGSAAELVSTKPIGILKKALEMNPNDKNLKAMLDNFTEAYYGAGPQVLGIEEKHFLDRMAAAIGISDNGSSLLKENTDGYAMLIASLTGNDKAKKLIDFKQNALYANVVANKQKIIDKRYANRANDNVDPIDLSQTPWIHSTPYPVIREADNSVKIYPAGHHNLNDVDLATGFSHSAPRASIHLSGESTVAGHFLRTGTKTQTRIMSRASDLVKNNDLPDNALPVDIWFMRDVGQSLDFENPVILKTYNDESIYTKDLISSGILKPNQKPNALTVDPNKNDLYLLKKSSYDQADRDAIQKFIDDAPDVMREETGMGMPLFSSKPGDEESTLDKIAIQLAKKKLGINTHYVGQGVDTLHSTSLTKQYRKWAELNNVGFNTHMGEEVHMSEGEIYGGLGSGSNLTLGMVGSDTRGKAERSYIESIRMSMLHNAVKTNIKQLKYMEEEDLLQQGYIHNPVGYQKPPVVEWRSPFPKGHPDYVEFVTKEQEKINLTLQEAIKAKKKRPRLASGGLITQNGLINQKPISDMYNLPSFATGIDYLPNDMIAQLHQGERVLTKEENKTYSSSAPTTNIININGSDLNKKEIAQAVMVELDRAQKKNNKTNMVGR